MRKGDKPLSLHIPFLSLRNVMCVNKLLTKISYLMELP